MNNFLILQRHSQGKVGKLPVGWSQFSLENETENGDPQEER